MEIKIITDQVGKTGGDECRYDKCHFEENPTLQQLADYCLSRTNEWGYIRIDNVKVFEFKWGKVIDKTAAFNLLKDTHIKLNGVGGGWSYVDYDCALALDYVSPRERAQITKDKLLAMELPFVIEGNCMTLYGCDATDEYILFWFRGEDKNIPDEINVVGLNNNVDLLEEETLTWQALQLAIFLCFTAHDGGTNKPIMDFVKKIPVEVMVTEHWHK